LNRRADWVCRIRIGHRLNHYGGSAADNNVTNSNRNRVMTLKKLLGHEKTQIHQECANSTQG
jgi:hypothetical protein